MAKPHPIVNHADLPWAESSAERAFRGRRKSLGAEAWREPLRSPAGSVGLAAPFP